jgi:hypothetical protein
MKKILVSLGLAAAGSASLHAAYAPDSSDNSKMWSLSGTLRGFYDDNYTTTPKKHGSTGFEASPSFSLNMPMQQTEIGLRYTYGLYYYQTREKNHQNPIDQTHQFDLWLDHAFTPRWEGRVEDSVTVAQEPALLTPGAAGTAQRINGNNIANTFKATLNTDWTRKFSTVLSYKNTLYDYQNSGGTAANPSYAGLLNRVEQTFGLDLQWHITEETTAWVGYSLGLANYTGDEIIAQNPPPPAVPITTYRSSIRNNLSHDGHVGIKHNFLDNLVGSLQAGVQYTDDYNDPNSTSSWGPEGNASLIYTYASGSYAQLGVTESRNATDTVQVDSNGHVTQDQASTVVYGSINHSLTPKLLGSAVGQYQYSTFHNGQFNSQSAKFYNLGLNLTYTFTRHLSSELGYNFDWYTTPVPGQDYTRNRIYLGVTATY